MKLGSPSLAVAVAVALAFVFPVYSAIALSSPLMVSTTSGTFRGVSSAPNKTDKWLGIPFAQPPLGSLRFKAPFPLAVPSPHGQIQDASQFGDACPQEPSATLGAAMSEDCLKLNVSGVLADIVKNAF